VLADRFLGQIAIEPLSTFIPTCDVPSRFLLIIAPSLTHELDDGRKPHALKEGLDVTLLNDLLQSRLVVLSHPDTPPFVEPPQSAFWAVKSVRLSVSS
jgi:hypothetical protein